MTILLGVWIFVMLLHCVQSRRKLQNTAHRAVRIFNLSGSRICKMITLYSAHQHVGHSEQSEWLEPESELYIWVVCYLLHCPIMSISTGWMSNFKWGWTELFLLHYFPWCFVFELQHRYIVQLPTLIPSVCTVKFLSFLYDLTFYR